MYNLRYAHHARHEHFRASLPRECLSTVTMAADERHTTIYIYTVYLCTSLYHTYIRMLCLRDQYVCSR